MVGAELLVTRVPVERSRRVEPRAPAARRVLAVLPVTLVRLGQVAQLDKAAHPQVARPQVARPQAEHQQAEHQQAEHQQAEHQQAGHQQAAL